MATIFLNIFHWFLYQRCSVHTEVWIKIFKFYLFERRFRSLSLSAHYLTEHLALVKRSTQTVQQNMPNFFHLNEEGRIHCG